MFPIELIPELRDHIVSFLGPWGVSSFSLTCHQALQDVESFSRRELDRIEREHSVDDTWRFRVGMQAAHDAAIRLSEEGENWQGVLVPNSVSHRRMLRSAYRTHLYALETKTASPRQYTHYFQLSASPDGKHLLSGSFWHGQGGTVRLWDLSTNQCIRSFVGSRVGFSSGRIVTSSVGDSRLNIWSMDGACHHALTLSNLNVDARIDAQAVTTDAVYAILENGGPIYAINTTTGSVRTMEQPWDETDSNIVVLRVCNNYLLHLRGDHFTYNLENHGIFVFDRDSMALQSHLPGAYRSMACNTNGQVAFAPFRGGPIEVFQLRDGNLVAVFSITITNVEHISLRMTKSKIIVISDPLNESKITVYNAIDGMKERSLSYPTSTNARPFCNTRTMASNDREVFVGFECSVFKPKGGTIVAFLH